MNFGIRKKIGIAFLAGFIGQYCLQPLRYPTVAAFWLPLP